MDSIVAGNAVGSLRAAAGKLPGDPGSLAIRRKQLWRVAACVEEAGS
jgi:hypothetical protein